MIVGVLVELSNKNIDRIFEYDVPDNLISKIKIGIRVLVPFGNMKLEGFVLSINDNKSTDKELRSIIDVIDDNVVLNDELLELGKIMQKNTLSTLISCYQVMLPKALKAKNGSVINVKYDTYYKLSGLDFSNIKFNDKQMEIINLFNSRDKILRQELVSISSSSVNTLLKKGVLIEEKSEHYRLKYCDTKSVINKLTSDQENVVSSVVNNSNSSTYLLHGVTGSGKTEVYMAIIEYYLNLGKNCIMLVPEISLTPQMVSRFQCRFGDKIAAIHSALSDGEKYDEWRRICRGEASIVIGARSAIFAPLENIGVIIIDEEHSDSYKQSDPNPRYSAKEIALIRAKYHNCSVIFGSATPSLESMARAKKGVYTLLTLENRVNGKSLPKVNVIDMNKGIRSSKGHFSLELLDAIN